MITYFVFFSRISSHEFTCKLKYYEGAYCFIYMYIYICMRKLCLVRPIETCLMTPITGVLMDLYTGSLEENCFYQYNDAAKLHTSLSIYIYNLPYMGFSTKKTQAWKTFSQTTFFNLITSNISGFPQWETVRWVQIKEETITTAHGVVSDGLLAIRFTILYTYTLIYLYLSRKLFFPKSLYWLFNFHRLLFDRHEHLLHFFFPFSIFIL